VLLDIDDTAGQEEMRALSEVKLDNKDAGSFSAYKSFFKINPCRKNNQLVVQIDCA